MQDTPEIKHDCIVNRRVICTLIAEFITNEKGESKYETTCIVNEKTNSYV